MSATNRKRIESDIARHVEYIEHSPRYASTKFESGYWHGIEMEGGDE